MNLFDITTEQNFLSLFQKLKKRETIFLLVGGSAAGWRQTLLAWKVHKKWLKAARAARLSIFFCLFLKVGLLSVLGGVVWKEEERKEGWWQVNTEERGHWDGRRGWDRWEDGCKEKGPLTAASKHDGREEDGKRARESKNEREGKRESKKEREGEREQKQRWLRRPDNYVHSIIGANGSAEGASLPSLNYHSFLRWQCRVSHWGTPTKINSHRIIPITLHYSEPVCMRYISKKKLDVF